MNFRWRKISVSKYVIVALKKSIRHWESNVFRAQSGKKFRFDSGVCALCKEFVGFRCTDCPVAVMMHDDGCGGSVWEKLNEHCMTAHGLDVWADTFWSAADCRVCYKFAVKELEFLKRLLEHCVVKND